VFFFFREREWSRAHFFSLALAEGIKERTSGVVASKEHFVWRVDRQRLTLGAIDDARSSRRSLGFVWCDLVQVVSTRIILQIGYRAWSVTLC